MNNFTKEEIISLSVPTRREVISGVYFLINKTEIAYVGSAFDILSRIQMHKKAKKINFNKMFIIRCDPKDKRQRLSIERSYIERFKPVNNISLNPDYAGYNKGNTKRI